MKKSNTKEFIEKAKKIHGDKYDYSLVEYVSSAKKVKIICKKHGVFEQSANSHLMGFRCPLCKVDKIKKAKTKNVLSFIEDSKKVHGNKYDYSLVKYVNSKVKVKIICSEHGVFEQTPNTHLRGSGCILCGRKSKGIGGKYDTIKFIEKAKKVHGNKYDYSLTKYINNNTKVKIICPKHGVFEQLPNNHIARHGCFKCKNLYISNTLSSNTKEFIEKAKKVHGNKYDYSLVEYINNRTKVKIICPEHGMFKQNANSHLKESGCPICGKKSKGESLILNFLTENNIKFEPQKTFENCVYKNKLRFDFYLIDYDVLIEFDGIQHFKPIPFWGGKKALKENYLKDKIKNKYCKEKDIKLFRIKYNEKIEKELKKIKNFIDAIYIPKMEDD